MAEEEKIEEVGRFAHMDFEEPDEQELYGFEEGEEVEEEEDARIVRRRTRTAKISSTTIPTRLGLNQKTIPNTT